MEINLDESDLLPQSYYSWYCIEVGDIITVRGDRFVAIESDEPFQCEGCDMYHFGCILPSYSVRCGMNTQIVRVSKVMEEL